MQHILLRNIGLELSLFLLLAGPVYSQPESTPMKCGFSAQHVVEGVERTQALQVDRLETQHHYLTRDSRFLIHYDTEGVNAVDPTSTIVQGIPDWIIETELALEKSFSLLADSLGFDEPPMDTYEYPQDPPGGAYDIYFRNWNYYGMTYFPEHIGLPGKPDAHAGYMVFENDFVGGFNTHGVSALQVTIAHELFHLFHLGYRGPKPGENFPSETWLYELTSSWFENVAYPEVDDYVYYVKTYFNSPAPLDGGYSLVGYRSAHYGDILSDYGEPALWEQIWENFITDSAYAAIDKGLRNIAGVDFADSYRQFAGWNLLTGTRAISGFGYADAEKFPEIATDGPISIPDSLPFSVGLERRGVSYLDVFHGNDSPEFYQMEFSGSSSSVGGAWAFPGQTLALEYFQADQSRGMSLNNPYYNGVMAIANPMDNQGNIRIIQKRRILRIFPNPYIPAEHGNFLRLYTILPPDKTPELTLYNLLGQKIGYWQFTELSGQEGPTTINVSMDTPAIRELGSGVYFFQLETGRDSKSAKFTLLR